MVLGINQGVKPNPLPMQVLGHLKCQEETVWPPCFLRALIGWSLMSTSSPYIAHMHACRCAGVCIKSLDCVFTCKLLISRLTRCSPEMLAYMFAFIYSSDAY